MRGLLLILLCLLISESCSKKKIEIPAGILNRDEMVPILVDVHLAHAAEVIRNPGDTLNYSFKDMLPFILNKHNVAKTLYDSSIKYYTAHPEVMREVYDEVINQLSRKQGEVKTSVPQIK